MAGARRPPGDHAGGPGARPQPLPPGLFADATDATPTGPPPVALRAGELTAGPLRPAILRLALPAVGTTLLQVLFNVTDTFWVGRTLGPAALAGVSSASYALWTIITAGEVVSIGLTAVASRRHGEGNPAAAARAAGTALGLAALVAVAVAVVGLAGMPALFRIMDVPADVARLGEEFLAIQVLGAFFIYGYFVVDASFRSAGDTRTPFRLLGVSVLLNLVLDPLMILGLGPFPRMGIYGAALATVLTRGLGFVAGIVLLIRRGAIRPALELPVAGRIFSVGAPVMLSSVLFNAIYVILVRQVRDFGTPALAALGIGHKVEGMSHMVSVGFALAAETLVGQNLGAGRPDRARRAGWTTATIATGATAVFGLAFALFPRPLAGLFTADPATIDAAALYLQAVAVAQLAVAFELVLEASLSGAGFTVWPMVWVALLSAIRVPLVAFIAPRFGLVGVWWVISLTAIGRGLAMAGLWAWSGWERKRV